MKMMYYNGKFLDEKKAIISPYDLGLLRGYGVFDVMRTQKGKPFTLEEHWKRFCNSARHLRLKVPISRKAYVSIVDKLLRVNGFKESIVRTVLTAGLSPDGFAPAGEQTFFILIQNFSPLPKRVYQKGGKVITLEHHREYPQAKVTNYVAAIQHHRERTRQRAVEILYTHQGKVLEASASNFFIVKQGGLITPKDDILLGITRNTVIKLAHKCDIAVEERMIRLDETLQADEAFITSTNKNIVPVVAIDNAKIGSGAVGPVTSVLMHEFEKLASVRSR
jgi:branched-chain amino acid aminotransferase